MDIIVCNNCGKVDTETHYDDNGYKISTCPVCGNIEKLERIKWTMKNKCKIDIDEMSDTHIQNTLHMLQANEFHLRKNMVTDGDFELLEQENYRYELDRIQFFITVFVNELKKRR